MFKATLNPDGSPLHPEMEQHLSQAVKDLRHAQGLLEDESILHDGFISRGGPMKTIRKLAHDTHHKHRRLEQVQKEQTLEAGLSY